MRIRSGNKIGGCGSLTKSDHMAEHPISLSWKPPIIGVPRGRTSANGLNQLRGKSPLHRAPYGLHTTLKKLLKSIIPPRVFVVFSHPPNKFILKYLSQVKKISRFKINQKQEEKKVRE